MTDFVWDSPAKVNWSDNHAVDQISGGGTEDREGTRSFPTLAEAVDFVMARLRPGPRAKVGVYPERGTALISLPEIERAWRNGPHRTDEDAEGSL